MLQHGGQKLNPYAEGRRIQCRKLLKHNVINNNAKLMEHGTTISTTENIAPYMRLWFSLLEVRRPFRGTYWLHLHDRRYTKQAVNRIISPDMRNPAEASICVLIQFCWCFCVHPVNMQFRLRGTFQLCYCIFCVWLWHLAVMKSCWHPWGTYM
jgi:hypothetical protein